MQKNVGAPARQQAKLPVSACLKINEYLAPDRCPELLHRVPEGGPVTYPLFGGEGAAEFLAPLTPEDVCVGGPDQGESDQQFDELSTGVQEAPAAIETSMDASMAARLQEEEHALGRASTTDPSGQGSLNTSWTDDEMKELLRTLQVPHFVRESMTHGQHNCLMDSILLALQDNKHIKPLEVHERATICSSIRRHLIEHHGIEPRAPDGNHSYLSHEDSFDAICNQLRSEHSNIWSADIDVNRLSIAAVVFDRFQRQQLYDSSGAWTAELEEVNAPVVSKPPNASGEFDEVLIQLYCNTHGDEHATPYHYEWISFKADRQEDEVESSAEDDGDDDYSNPAPPPILTSDDEDDPLPLLASDNENKGALPLPAPAVDQNGDNSQALAVPEPPCRTLPSTLSSSACMSLLIRIRMWKCELEHACL